jgi:hypothetical protein
MACDREVSTKHVHKKSSYHLLKVETGASNLKRLLCYISGEFRKNGTNIRNYIHSSMHIIWKAYRFFFPA